jgi:hypothetical protein
MSTEIIRYDIDLINKIESNIDTILNKVTINKLLEIKKNNKFLKNTHAVRLKYSMVTSTANKWKEDKLNKDRPEDTFKESINLYLNKLSKKLYDNISDKIINTIKEYGLLQSKQIILDEIFNKSINEKNYACLYCRLCIQLIELYGNDFKTDILNKAEEFYNNNIKSINENQTQDNYNEFCDNNKLKTQVIGIYIFMAYLYTNNIISNEVILKYINSLFNTIYADKEKETNIACLCELITVSGKYLQKKFNNDTNDDINFNTVIMNRLNKITQDRKTFKPKLRFLIMNVIDLYKD